MSCSFIQNSILTFGHTLFHHVIYCFGCESFSFKKIELVLINAVSYTYPSWDPTLCTVVFSKYIASSVKLAQLFCIKLDL